MGPLLNGPENVSRIIQLILAPVVMITACAIMLGGILSRFAAINDRLRNLTHERLDLLRAQDPGDLIAHERIRIIDNQFPDLLKRLRMEHDATLTLYGAILVFILDMFFIAVVAIFNASWAALLAIMLFLIGIGVMGSGLLRVAQEVRTSLHAVTFEVEQVQRLEAMMHQRNGNGKATRRPHPLPPAPAKPERGK